MWTLIRLLLKEHTACKNDFKNHKQMTKQTTIVVIGALRVKKISVHVYTGDPIHRGPLFRDIQYIANRPWTPNLP